MQNKKKYFCIFSKKMHYFCQKVLADKSYLMKTFFFLLFFTILSYLSCSGQTYAPLPDWYYDYDVKFYKIDIEADDKSADVKGYTEIIAEISVNGLNRFTLELADDVRVDSVFINGQKTTFSREADLLHVHSPQPLSLGSKCSVTVFYAAIDIKSDGFFSAVTNGLDFRWNIPVT